MVLGRDSSNKHYQAQVERVVGSGSIDQLKAEVYWYVQASIYTSRIIIWLEDKITISLYSISQLSVGMSHPQSIIVRGSSVIQVIEK